MKLYLLDDEALPSWLPHDYIFLWNLPTGEGKTKQLGDFDDNLIINYWLDSKYSIASKLRKWINNIIINTQISLSVYINSNMLEASSQLILFRYIFTLTTEGQARRH